jgi:putative phage-type endonuclease
VSAEQDTRRFTIGGSDCGAACGVHPYLSPIGLWAIKTGRAPQPESEAMEWGTRLQLPIMDALAERGYDIRDAFDHEPLVDEVREWATGSPDGYTMIEDEPAVLEINTASVWAHRSGWDDALPPHYAAQGQWYMHLTGTKRCVFAVLVGGQHLEVRTVERSDHAIRLLLRECAKFHSCLVTDTQPAPDGSKSSRDALNAIFPQAEPEQIVRLTRKQMATVDELRALKEKASALDVQIAERENLLRAAMGEAERAISPNDVDVVKWSNVVSHRVDTKRLKADRPDIAGEYTTETQSRRFTVLPKGE